MERVLGEFEDGYGNSYLLLSDPDDGDPRNARNAAVPPGRIRQHGTGGRVVQVGSGLGGSVPSSRPTQQTQPAGQYHQQPTIPGRLVPRDSTTVQAGKVLRFVEVFTDGAAELIPLPDLPPTPTGNHAVDHQNQNEHRQALHAHRVLTSRVRASGRVLSNIFRLLME